MRQRSDVGGRTGGHGRREAPLTDPGRAVLPVQEMIAIVTSFRWQEGQAAAAACPSR